MKKDGLGEYLNNWIDKHPNCAVSHIEFADAIRLWISQNLPKELDSVFASTGNNEERKYQKYGFNECLAQVKERLL